MATPEFVKRINQARILSLLYSEESASRAQMARTLGLTRSALSKHVTRLLTAGLIVETAEKDGPDRTGRPGVVLRLNRRENYFIGVEIGGQLLRVIALDFEARLICERTARFELGADPNFVVALLKRVLSEMLLEERLNPERTRGVGIAISGLATKTGNILFSPALGWRNVPILELAELALGQFADTVLQNDANASAFAEAYVERKLESAEHLFVLVDAGVGVGVLNEGRIFRGADGFAGELGPVRLSLLDGSGADPTQTFETVVARDGLLDLARRQGLNCRSVEDLDHLLEAGDERAMNIALQWGRHLTQGLLALTVLFDPREIILGGRGVTPFKWIAKTVEGDFRDQLQQVREGYPPPTLRLSTLGDAAAAVGCACMLHQRMFSVESVLSVLNSASN